MPRSGLSVSFEAVLADIVRWLAEDSIELPGLDDALDAAEDAGVDRELAATFLIGLEATKTWYAVNRGAYDLARNLTDGNSRYSARHAELIVERKELNRSAFHRRQNLILFGYMDACGSSRISKPYIDPLAECIREILALPDYASEGVDVKERVYKVLHKRGSALRNSDLRTIREARELFQEIHATRTVLAG